MDAVTNYTCKNFDKMQMIFKTGNRKFRMFDAGLVALESTGKGIYYGAVEENFPRQRPAPQFLRQIFLLHVQCCIFFPTEGRDRNFQLSHNLHLVKILARTIIYTKPISATV